MKNEMIKKSIHTDPMVGRMGQSQAMWTSKCRLRCTVTKEIRGQDETRWDEASGDILMSRLSTNSAGPMPARPGSSSAWMKPKCLFNCHCRAMSWQLRCHWRLCQLDKQLRREGLAPRCATWTEPCGEDDCGVCTDSQSSKRFPKYFLELEKPEAGCIIRRHQMRWQQQSDCTGCSLLWAAGGQGRLFL